MIPCRADCLNCQLRWPYGTTICGCLFGDELIKPGEVQTATDCCTLPRNHVGNHYRCQRKN